MARILKLNRVVAAFAAGAAMLFCIAVLLCSEGAAGASAPAPHARHHDSGSYSPLQNSLFCLCEQNSGAPFGGCIQAARPQSGCARLRRIALKFNHVFMRGGELVLSVGGSFVNPALSIRNTGARHEVRPDLVVSLRKLRL